MRQMADLVRQAEDIFSSLEVECRSVNTRSRTVLARINNIRETVQKQDSLTEKVGRLLPPVIEDNSTLLRYRGSGLLSEVEKTFFLQLSGGEGPLPAGHETEMCLFALLCSQVSRERQKGRGARTLVSLHSNTDGGQSQIFQRGD